MNIQQMHIEVDLSSQKIASNVKRKFEPEEIDWILNKSIERFVKSRIKPSPNEGQGGFQFDEIDMDALGTLLNLDIPLPVYKTQASQQYVMAELPGNYLYLVRSASGVVRSCNDSYVSASTFSAEPEYIYKLKVKKTTKPAAPFYTNANLTIDATVVLSTEFPVNLPDRDMNFVIEDVLKNNLLKSTAYKFYWERYKDIFEDETLILVSKTVLTTVTLNYDTDIIMGELISSSQMVPDNKTPIDIRSNRLPRSNRIEEYQDSSFASSRWNSPITAVQGNTLKIYHDDKFIVSSAVLNYIRKPQLVSLSLNKGCDLAPQFHQTICDWTVEYIKNAIGDPNYQWKVQDDNTRGK